VSPLLHPPEASKVGLEGEVAVGVRVDEEGRVVEAVALGGDAPLTEAAVEAVRQWRYEPFVLDGSRRAFTSTVRVTFTLQRPTMWTGELIDGLSSRYEAVRECAAIRLGRKFSQKRASSESRKAARELKALLHREESPRVRRAAELALASVNE
jgi:TonB family protein